MKRILSYTKDGERYYSDTVTDEDIRTAYLALKQGIISDVVLKE